MLDGEGFCDEVFLVLQVHDVPIKQGTEGDGRFTGQLQVGRQSGVHHFAKGAAVVLPHPLPKAQLLGPNDGRIVDDGKDGFGFVPGGLSQYVQNQRRVLPLGSKLHLYPHPHLHLADPFFGHRVGVRLGHRHGQDDSDVGIGLGRGMQFGHFVTQIVLRVER